MNGYVFLAISIVSEVIGTMMLKLSNGFTEIGPVIGVVIGYGISFYGLSLCLKTLPLSLAYAIWSGVGTAFTVVLGSMIFGDPFNLFSGIGMILIIGGVILLNQGNKHQATE